LNGQRNFLKIAKVVTIVSGLIIAGLGGLGGILYVTQLASPDEAVVGGAVGSAALLVAGLGLGGALAWQGRRALRGEVSGPFRLPPLWLLLLLYLPVVVVGQLLITFELWPTLTFPPVHILAASIPSLAVLALAGRVLQAARPRWREIILQLNSGAFLSIGLGLLAEIILGAILFFIVALLVALTPGGMVVIDRLIAILEAPALAQNPDILFELITAPPVLVTLAVVVIVLAPMIEELAKLLGVALMSSYRRPSRRQAYLWGLASGAGFALAENLFNTVTALDIWAVVMLLRLGGTAMHCLGSGLTALGWQHLLVQRRPWKLAGAYGLSVSLHALWNLAVAGIAGISLVTAGAANDRAIFLGGGAILLLLGFLILLALGIIVALVALTYRLRGEGDSAGL